MKFQVPKTVSIRRTKLEGLLPGEGQENQIRKIGASLTKGGKSLRGLTNEEERLYLPDILGMSPNDNGWHDATENFWKNIGRPVDIGSGIKLQVGFEYDTEEGAKKDARGKEGAADGGKPINPSDYVLYRYCLRYNKVANKKEDINKTPNIWFYIDSPEERLKIEKAHLAYADKALVQYLQTKSDPETINLVLRLFEAEPTYEIPAINTLNDDRKMIEYKRIVDERPKTYLEVVSDPDLRLKAFIEECIIQGHLRRVTDTSTIYYGDTTLIGNNINEAVMYFKTEAPTNTKVMASLKAKLVKMDVANAPAIKRVEQSIDPLRNEDDDELDFDASALAKDDDSEESETKATVEPIDNGTGGESTEDAGSEEANASEDEPAATTEETK